MPNQRRERGSGSVALARRKLKVAGQAHVSCTNKQVAAKKKPDCESKCKCKFACKTLSYARKLELFNKFYTTDSSTQGTFIMGLINVGRVKRRRHGKYEDPAQSHRQSTMHYCIPDGSGEMVTVCKTTFMDIFGISRKRVQTIINKKKIGETVFKDKRTRNCGRKFTDEDVSCIKNHINSIPRDVSHYTRAKSSKEFLSPDLNVFRLHKAFQQKYPHSLVTYQFYRSVFLKYFKHLSFKRPRIDTCRTCDRLNCEVLAKNGKSSESKRLLNEHHKKAEDAINSMRTDILYSQEPGSDTTVLSIDLQQVLFVPTLTHADMFYLSQLSCYNLCINMADNHQSYMCLWNEGIAGRGGNEISSCLLRLINEGITYKKKLKIWSDNCAAQNKNRMVIFVYLFLISVGMFESIEHKFLISGHSFLQCDRDFALIEKRKRRTKPMIPADLHDVILNSTHTGRFHIMDMTDNKFFDMQTAADNILNLKSANISKAVHIKLDKNHLGVIFCKETHDEDAVWKRTSILKRGKTPRDLEKLLIDACSNESRISENKRKHLESMIPFMENQQHKDYYINLLNLAP